MKKYVIGRVKIRAGQREAYLARGRDYLSASRKDAGLIYYRQGLDTDDPDGVIVVECWESPEAHAAHTKSGHFAAFGPVFMEYVVEAHFEEMNVGEVNDVVVGGKG